MRRELRLKGSDRDVLEKARRDHFLTLLKYSSASSMWTANAATVSPSLDTKDGRVHVTPANLISQKHRAIEVSQTASFLKHIFHNKKYFSHHRPLPNNGVYADEGAANHLRLSAGHGVRGVEVFVYGKAQTAKSHPRKYPARQSREAAEAISRSHRLSAGNTLYFQQNPSVIDQGVFHNDVIAVSNENVLLYHEDAFIDSLAVEIITKNFPAEGQRFFAVKVPRRRLTVSQAISSYFFNSQIVTLPSGKMALIAPQECKDGGKIESLIRDIVSQDNPIERVHFVDLVESMKNGGGPACLRLRVVLNFREVCGVHPGFLLNARSLSILERWVRKYYRDKLHINDLGSYDLLEESRAALDELTRLLKLGSLYSFQK